MWRRHTWPTDEGSALSARMPASVTHRVSPSKQQLVGALPTSIKPSTLPHANAACGDVHDQQPTISGDLHSVRRRRFPRQPAEVFDRSVGPPPANVAGRRFSPHDRAIRVCDQAVRKDRLRKGDHNLRDTVGRDGVDITGVRVRWVIGAGIGEDQSPVGAKTRSFGPFSRTPSTCVTRTSAVPPSRTH